MAKCMHWTIGFVAFFVNGFVGKDFTFVEKSTGTLLCGLRLQGVEWSGGPEGATISKGVVITPFLNQAPRLSITGDHRIGEYNLQIRNVMTSDAGTYVCYGNNGTDDLAEVHTLFITSVPEVEPLQEDSNLSFEAGLGIGAGGILIVEVVIISCVLIFTRCRTSSSNKDNLGPGTIYEEPPKDVEKQNVYNELSEFPKVTTGPDTVFDYEEPHKNEDRTQNVYNELPKDIRQKDQNAHYEECRTSTMHNYDTCIVK